LYIWVLVAVKYKNSIDISSRPILLRHPFITWKMGMRLFLFSPEANSIRNIMYTKFKRRWSSPSPDRRPLTPPHAHQHPPAIQPPIPFLATNSSLLSISHRSPLANPLYGKSKLLPFQNFGIINPEEIRVQHRLHQASHYRNAIPMMLIHKIPPDPVRNIQRPITAQGKEIMRRNRFCLACSLQQE
jgi:hypothetical protein